MPATERITETTLLRGLTVGLALVIVLLGAAGFVAVRGTRAIEDDTATIVREQLVMARLLNDAQAGQNMMAAVLHQVARTPENAQESRLLAELEQADNALDRVSQSTDSLPEAAQWKRLHQATDEFSAGVRQAIQVTGAVPETTVQRLFQDHDRTMRLERELLAVSEKRVSAMEAQIEDESRQLARQSVLLLGGSFGLAAVCSALTIMFVRNSVRKMRWQAEELGRVSWHMLQSQEDNARRFAHELHDELGQSLAAVRAHLVSEPGTDWLQRREDCLQLVDGAIANVRELSQLLRPVVLDDFGLDAGLRWLTERFAGRTGIRVSYDSTFHGRLRDESETHLFRIAQEALTNIARHSGATNVAVRLDSQGAAVRLTIEDNGRGLRLRNEDYTPSLGMTGMRARAREAGGSMQLSKPTGGGLCISVEVPQIAPEEARVG